MAITSGGGAAAVTIDIINNMWDNAKSRTDDANKAVSAAIAIADPAPHIEPVPFDPGLELPGPPEIKELGNPIDEYNTQRDQLFGMITDTFAEFIKNFFGDPTFYNDAVDWCHDAFTVGGTGINRDVEQQLWERGRARILADSERTENEAMSTWANRRFPLPPGALTGQINDIRLDAGRKLAEQSRDISVKGFDTEIENVRFGLTKVIDQRKIALDAAGDYIKTIMLGPQVAMQLTVGLANVSTEMARALTAMYQAEVTAIEPLVRLQITDAELKTRVGEANLRAATESMNAKVRAAIEGAQMIGTQAAAGLNALHAQASISGQDISQV